MDQAFEEAAPSARHGTSMHVFANPARFLKIARPLTPWLAIA